MFDYTEIELKVKLDEQLQVLDRLNKQPIKTELEQDYFRFALTNVLLLRRALLEMTK